MDFEQLKKCFQKLEKDCATLGMSQTAAAGLFSVSVAKSFLVLAQFQTE